jgi:pimeloyl-ACP methyl ester carboxylesterase
VQVIVDGLLTNYQKSGSGRPVVLLHGWGDSAATFKVLAQHLTGFQLLALELPGFGSQMPGEAWGVDDYAQFVKTWLDKIGIKKVQAIIGHSVGGAIAIDALGLGLIKPSKLVLLAPSGIRGEKSAKRTAITVAAKAGKIISKPLPLQSRQLLKNLLYKSTGSEALLFPQLEESFRKIVKQDLRGVASKIETPTLIVYGQLDTDTPPRYGQLFADTIPSSKFEVIPGAAHFLHQDMPEVLGRRIKEFIK